MSTATLEGLRDYLYGTLSRNNMLWLATQLTEYANKQADSLSDPLTMEEIDAMLDEVERDFEKGEYLTHDDVFNHQSCSLC